MSETDGKKSKKVAPSMTNLVARVARTKKRCFVENGEVSTLPIVFGHVSRFPTRVDPLIAYLEIPAVSTQSLPVNPLVLRSAISTEVRDRAILYKRTIKRLKESEVTRNTANTRRIGASSRSNSGEELSRYARLLPLAARCSPAQLACLNNCFLNN